MTMIGSTYLIIILIRKKSKSLPDIIYETNFFFFKNRTVLAKTCNLNLHDSLGSKQWKGESKKKVIERNTYLTLNHDTD